ncbi:hypothetical protein [Okeania sp. SIO2C2]|uniref:hypothetical protein n=1 Tax=Okeania sp. SIO2C2 TaxID=2607787 RepID=UPI00257F0020|nr:hypothetical protein [Okeania sp. SIO2C2]
MMTLPPELESSFQSKINQYEEEQRVEFLNTIEELAIERGQKRGQEIGQEIGAKATCRQNILDLLEKRFNSLPETLVKAVNEINDLYHVPPPGELRIAVEYL